MAFKHKLEEIRKARGFSLAQMAKEVGISEQQYIDYECGPIYANFVERIGILVALGYGVDKAREILDEPDGSSFDDLLSRHLEPMVPFVQMREGVIEFIDRYSSRVVYDISTKQIYSLEFVMRWIEHLGGKTWCTQQHIREFVRVCSEYLGTSLHPVG